MAGRKKQNSKLATGAEVRKRSAKIFFLAILGGFLSVVFALVASLAIEPSTSDSPWLPNMRIFSRGEKDAQRRFFRPSPEHRPWRRYPIVKEK